MFESFVTNKSNALKTLNIPYLTDFNANIEASEGTIIPSEVNSLTAGVARLEAANISAPVPVADDCLVLSDRSFQVQSPLTLTSTLSNRINWPSLSSTDTFTGQPLSDEADSHNPLHPIVQQAWQLVRGYLGNLAVDSDFNAKMNLAFGNNWNVEVASAIAEQFAKGDFNELPPVVTLPTAAIHGANGAFAAVTNTIYLSNEFIAKNATNPEAIAKVLLEEIGHYIDSQINTVDASGDEGAIFAALVVGQELTQPEIAALKAEDDTAAIALEGKEILIERSSATPKTDFNNDGKADIIWRNYNTGQNQVWLMNGTNKISSTSLGTVADANWRIESTGDFNNDGKTDIIWRNYNNGQNQIWLMNGSSIISTASLSAVSDINWRIEGTGDFNSDGKADILWRNYNNGQNQVWLMNGTKFSSSASLTTVADTNWRIQGASDFNSDGKSDILWRNYNNGQNQVWLMNGSTKISSASLTTVSDTKWQVGQLGDFNNDGKVDIAWRNYSNGQNQIWLMNGTTSSASASLSTVADANWQMTSQWSTTIPKTDFNNDGKTDILWRNYSNGQNQVWLMNGSTKISSASLGTVADANWRIESTADFNSDGKTDILWRNYSNGQNQVWLMNGSTKISSASLTTVSDLNWRIEGTGDFNSDGKSDIIWRNYSNGQNQVWLMNGSTKISSASLTTVADANWRIQGAGDFNNDGKSDILWRNYNNGQNQVWLMNGSTKISSVSLSTVSDTNWQVGQLGDFNNDAKVDIAWRNSSNGQNLVWLMNGTQSISSASFATVADANWQMTEVPNNPPTNIVLSATSIAEHSANGKAIATLSTTDDPGDTHTYSLLNNANGRFTIDGTQLKVANGSLLDFEVNASHNITIRTTDATGNKFDKNITISVANINETQNWLSYVNFLRSTANLPPVTENPAWRDGAEKHSKYLVKNDLSGHYEEPANQFYTAEGAEAGQNGNVLVGSNVNLSDTDAIDGWMNSPFHAIGILNPNLLQAGYGAYREADGGIQASATLDVLRGTGTIPSSVQFPVKWPTNGVTIPASLRKYGGGEWPDPLTSTPGYTNPVGLPLILQLGNGSITPNVTAHSFLRGNTPLEHAVFDETNYTNPNNTTFESLGNTDPNITDQTHGRAILDSRDAIVLIPRNPLLPGETYTASITANGQTYIWSFKVGPLLPIVGTAGDDNLYGEELNDTISGNAGNDLLVGDDGNDSLNGGEGLDNLFSGIGNDTLNGNAGDDQLSGNEGNDLLNGGDANDNLFGDVGNDTLNGNAGDDYLSGDVGNDSLIGNVGDDYLSGDDGSDLLNGGEGLDNLYGGVGSDTFIFGIASGMDSIGDFVVTEDTIQVAASFGLSVNDLLAQANSYPDYSEITLSQGNTITVWHDAPLSADNFIVV